jgi:hypothetical protein
MRTNCAEVYGALTGGIGGTSYQRPGAGRHCAPPALSVLARLCSLLALRS